jgi:integrase/recombinase XerD
MISMKMVLDQRRPKLDGSFPIVFRISYQRKTRDISTGCACKYSEWNASDAIVIVTDDATLLLQQRLRLQWLKYQEKLLEFERKLLDPTKDIQDIKNFLAGRQSITSTVKDLWDEEIKRLEATKRFGNARNYKSAYGAIVKVSTLNIPLAKIDFNWLTKLETSLVEKGVSINGIAVYMRTLRALYNKAINAGLVEPSLYPFRRYKIRTSSTSPRVVSLAELKKFFSYNPVPESHTYNAWNYGRLIFLLRGINFADLALLTRENLKGDRIIYKRAKTHKDYSVKLLPLAKNILEIYNDPERITLLPILSELELKNKKSLPERIGQLRKTTNKWLSKIGKELELEEELSTYVFRYSHANGCKSLGYSKDIISESLGHAYGLAVSSCYLENYSIELIDEMNASIYHAVVCSE